MGSPRFLPAMNLGAFDTSSIQVGGHEKIWGSRKLGKSRTGAHHGTGLTDAGLRLLASLLCEELWIHVDGGRYLAGVLPFSSFLLGVLLEVAICLQFKLAVRGRQSWATRDGKRTFNSSCFRASSSSGVSTFFVTPASSAARPNPHRVQLGQ